MPAQAAFDRIDQIVHRAHRQRRVDAAVKIDDLAVGGFAHAHVVDFVEAGMRGGLSVENGADFGDAFVRGIAASEHVGR